MSNATWNAITRALEDLARAGMVAQLGGPEFTITAMARIYELNGLGHVWASIAHDVVDSWGEPATNETTEGNKV